MLRSLVIRKICPILVALRDNYWHDLGMLSSNHIHHAKLLESQPKWPLDHPNFLSIIAPSDHQSWEYLNRATPNQAETLLTILKCVAMQEKVHGFLSIAYSICFIKSILLRNLMISMA